MKYFISIAFLFASLISPAQSDPESSIPYEKIKETALVNNLQAATELEVYRHKQLTSLDSAYFEEVSGYISVGTSNYKLALDHYRKSLSVFERLNDDSGQARINMYIGQMHYSLGQFDDAHAYYDIAADIYLKIEDYEHLARIQSLYAALLSSQGQHQEALNVMESALNDLKPENDKIKCELYLNKALVYRYLLQDDSAEYYIDLAGICYASISEMSYEYGTFLVAKFSFYRLIDQLSDELLNELLKAEVIFQQVGSKNSLANVYAELAYFYMNQGNFQIAGQYSDSVLLFGVNPQSVLKAYDLKAAVYLALNNSDSAFYYLDQFYALKEQFNQQIAAEKIAMSSEKLKIEIIALENEKLHLALEIKERVIWQNKVTLVMIIVGVLLLSLILYLFWIKRRYKLKAEIEQLNIKAVLAQLNPHFIYNSLNSIQAYYLANDVIKANDFLSDFSFLTRKILNASQQTHHSLADEIEISRTYLSIEQKRLDNRFEFSITCDDVIDQDITQVPSLILQPILENAVWHGISPASGPGEISVECKLIKDSLRIIIRDNGVGMKKESVSEKNFGLSLVRQRVKLLQIKSDETGTEVNIEI